MHTIDRQHGFTLIELVVTLVISTIVVAFVSLFISGPVQGFADQARRVRLVDAADAALERIGRDVRRSLPNSVRVTSAAGVTALEVMSTVDGARYRAQPPGGAAQILDFATADGSLNVLGPFTQIAKPFSSTSHYLAVYNVGVAGADAYELANVITPAGTTITIAADGATGEDRVTLAPCMRASWERRLSA
jgi:MSHA biogenesis protein MshO